MSTLARYTYQSNTLCRIQYVPPITAAELSACRHVVEAR